MVLMLFCLCTYTNVFADDHAITGKILSDKNQPIEGAVVLLLSLPDSVFVANAVTDSLGTFGLAANTEAQKGGLLVVSCIGYERKEMSVTGEKSLLITLKETSHQLKGVTVTSKSTVKGLPGGYAFTPGGAEMLLQNGLDLLKVTPMLDVSGGMQILGKGNANVYINGRDPHMPVSMVLDMLRMVPPKDVYRIEIMYNPGSSQRASDQSGLVNIVMRRPDYGWQGYAGVYLQSVNGHLEETPVVYLGYGHGRFRFSTSVQGLDSRTFSKSEKKYDYKADALSVQNTSWDKNYCYGGSVNANATYDITGKSQIGLSVGTSVSDIKHWTGVNTMLANGEDGTVKQGGQTAVAEMPKPWLSYAVTAFYSLTTDDNGSSLDASMGYSNRTHKTTTHNDILADMGMDDWVSNPYDETEIEGRHGASMEVKYKKRFAKGGSLGVGGSYDISHIDLDNQWLDLVDGAYVDNALRSNRFVYDENVAGVYVDYDRRWTKHFSSVMGLRGEQTHMSGKVHATDESFTRDYFNVVPNVSLSFNSTNQKHIIGINYMSFIIRSPYSRLNPFKYWDSQNSYMEGNPNLKPEVLHSLGISYRFLQWYEFSVSGSYKPSLQTSYTVQDGNGVSRTGYGDLGRSRGFGLGLSAYRSLFGGLLYLDGRVSGSYKRMEGKIAEYPLNTHLWSYSAQLRSTVFFSKARDFYMQMNYYLSGAYREPAETRPVKHILTGVISKKFAFGGTVALGFTGTFPWKNKTFYDTSSYYYQSRDLTSPTNISISFSQEFGKKRVRGAEGRSNSRFDSRN